MTADRHSDFGEAVQALMDGRITVADAHSILCFLTGFCEGDDQFREGFTREVYFYLKLKAEKAQQ